MSFPARWVAVRISTVSSGQHNAPARESGGPGERGAGRCIMRTPLRIGAPLGVLLMCCGLAYSNAAQALAWDFIPTALEWQSWPLYCKVQFSSVTQGLEDEYAGWAYSQTEISTWRQALG